MDVSKCVNMKMRSLEYKKTGFQVNVVFSLARYFWVWLEIKAKIFNFLI